VPARHDVVVSDLFGRSEGYRGLAIRCPGCAEPMQKLDLSARATTIDVCEACLGAWVDWFDGDLRAVAAEAILHAPRPTMDRPSRNEVVAIGACPRCTRQLVPQRYERATGVELLRCEDCMGAFLSRPNAEALSWHEGSEPATQPSKPSPWDGLVRSVRKLFG
jgi:Zn-finger nucleic acid-binding protein